MKTRLTHLLKYTEQFNQESYKLYGIQIGIHHEYMNFWLFILRARDLFAEQAGKQECKLTIQIITNWKHPKLPDTGRRHCFNFLEHEKLTVITINSQQGKRGRNSTPMQNKLIWTVFHFLQTLKTILSLTRDISVYGFPTFGNTNTTNQAINYLLIHTTFQIETKLIYSFYKIRCEDILSLVDGLRN